MRKHLPTIILVSVFLIGFAVLLYPAAADILNMYSRSRAIARYSDELSRVSEETYEKLLDEAREYNLRLSCKSDRYLLSDDELEEYSGMLDFNGDGMFGTLEISVIGVSLPIYRGTDAAVLQRGIGHLEGSSLPVGGPGTHAVISGHSGLPSAMLLTNLDRVNIDDMFTLNILNETLTYEVDQILVVEPEDFSALTIEADTDYCTIVTCTPYGINTHRLLVRGRRVPNTVETFTVTDDVRLVDDMLVFSAAAAFVLLVIFRYLLVKLRTRKVS